MNILKDVKLDVPTVLKAAVIGAAGILVIALAILFVRITSSSWQSVSTIQQNAGGVASSMPAYDRDSYATKESAGYSGNDAGMELSLRNVTMPSPVPPVITTTGDTAEEFEITDYTVNFETRRRDETCQAIADLKTRDYIIFENASTYDQGCGFTFKVKAERVKEVLDTLQSFNPKDFSENTYTIKQQVDDFTSELDILKSKLTSIDETLANAIRAYDELTELARNARDVESLTKIIDSKLNLIERLTQQRIDVVNQLERITRAKNDALDRLDYTYFYVSVVEKKYLDGEQLADSWKEALREFVQNVNQTAQDVTIRLVALLFVVAQYVVYLLIVVIIAKYLWRLVRYIWNNR